MKKILSLLLVAVLLVSSLSIMAFAKGTEDTLLSRTVEVLDNGDTVITELYENAMQPRTGKKGHKVGTYTSGGKEIWSVRVDGTFEYTYGVSSKATNATATVTIYEPNAAFVRKNSYVTTNKAIATAEVSYHGVSATRTVSISCDIYGNLS